MVNGNEFGDSQEDNVQDMRDWSLMECFLKSLMQSSRNPAEKEAEWTRARVDTGHEGNKAF